MKTNVARRGLGVLTKGAMVAAAGLALLGVPVAAHHGRADAYDTQNPLKVTGTVTEVAYANPHIQLYFDTTDEQGKVTHWAGEMTDIGILARAGWPKKRFLDALKPGTKINLIIQKAKAPQPEGKGVAVVVEMRDLSGNVIGLIRGGGALQP
jgi:hypothetical protein